MDKQDFVNYRALVLEVRQLRSFLAQLESSMYAPAGQRFTSTPRAHSGKGSTMDALVIKHLELEGLYREKIAEKDARLLEIEQAIESLADPAERLIMRLRYLEGRSWVNICSKLQTEGYSERQVYYLHGFALKKLRDAGN